MFSNRLDDDERLRYRLQVDRQTKASFATYDEAEEDAFLVPYVADMENAPASSPSARAEPKS